ncbi:hypothetical protein SPRG_16377 [Saprolegnia parasitica CBS 223.65]|uniref:Serine aminopeptidase S33 domain-containing protein n=1 Tax=Saprolegnia parasitica (strain CBS 223.65) TaxID=695850 RepID=A0A067BIG1_SAPPC|nr:hypothetical protein SPRG_16377 [Saprolegnia parasitica CBS 223.65]KDO18169.1 hypothetical protein SPRG_16377 [Saprolegnia parasitica CBS 223.65]|eukprot:XP_012211127.1 hypothetical protein SPRG_16377 [Saprolegnia parasitica CBS 223.65]
MSRCGLRFCPPLTLAAAGSRLGPFVTGGYEERLQLQAVLSTLAVLEPTYKTVFLWGHSLGAATALEFAATTPEETIVAGLVLDSPYTSLADMIQSCFENAKNQGLYLPGVVLWMTMALARKSIQSRAGFSLDAVHPEHASRKCTMPALFFNGSHDLYVPPLMASRLHTAYAGHATHLPFDGDHYGQRPIGVQKSAIAFLKSLITRA